MLLQKNLMLIKRIFFHIKYLRNIYNYQGKKLFDFDGQSSSIYASGEIEAIWDEDSISNFSDLQERDDLYEKAKEDVLSTTSLNFYDSENQIYQRYYWILKII